MPGSQSAAPWDAPPPPKPLTGRQRPAKRRVVCSPHLAVCASGERSREAARNYASRVTPPPSVDPDETPARRLWELQDAAQRLTPRPYALDEGGHPRRTEDGRLAPSAFRKCRRVRVEHKVDLVVNQGRASFRGLATCRSVWECPSCARRVRAERAELVRSVAHRWWDMGGACYLATFTVRHGWSDRLAMTAQDVARAWQHMQRGRSWQKWTAQGVQSVRAIEITHGEHGWHPHVHVVFFVPKKQDEKAVAAWLDARWKRAVRHVMGPRYVPGADAQGVERGTDFRPLPWDKATYIAKLGGELTDPTGAKLAKRGNRTPWQILESAAAGHEGDTWLWKEYAAATVGRRFLTWSRGLRPWRELAEAELDAQRELDAQGDEWIDTLEPREWDSLRDLPDFRCEVLLAATRGKDAVLEVLCEFKELRAARIRGAPDTS